MNPRSETPKLTALDTASALPELALEGERGFTPRGPLLTALLVVTGLLPFWHIAISIARALLGLRRPMTLRFSSRGVSVHERFELAGRVLRDQERWIPRDNLAKITRQESRSGLALYVGIIALIAGTRWGAHRVLDGLGVSGGSLELVGTGLLILAIAVGADFVLWSLQGARRASCRLIVVPRTGGAFCCAGIQRADADAALRTLSAEVTAAPDTTARDTAAPG